MNQKRPFILILFEGYIFFIGLIFILNGAMVYLVEKATNPYAYKALQARMTDLKQVRSEKGILPTKSESEFNGLLKKFENFIQNFKSQRIDRFQLYSFIIALLGILAGVLYLFAGFKLFNMSPQAGGSLLFAIISGVIFVSLFLLTLYGNLDIICQATYQVTQMGSFIKEDFAVLRPSPFDLLLQRPMAIDIILMMILFYLIIPLLILISIRKMGQHPPDSQFKP
ncbi:MAG: hypothetical protein Q7S13_03355 [Candidatus Omnitrophota bacterium]|nr:hypothetical protein [Candidatus Omnitrophota bacterium]